MKITVNKKDKNKHIFIGALILIIGIVILNYLSNSMGAEVVDTTSEISSSEVSEVPYTDNVGLTKNEQKNIDEENQKKINENLANGINYIVIPKLGVSLPIYSYNAKLSDNEIDEVLSKGALTYNMYGSPGHGNYILFGHNSGAYPKGYFTPLVNGLSIGDVVTIRTKNKDYQYKIIDRKTIGETEVNKVYYKSKKPIITIGTCDIPSATTPNRIIFSGELIED